MRGFSIQTLALPPALGLICGCQECEIPRNLPVPARGGARLQGLELVDDVMDALGQEEVEAVHVRPHQLLQGGGHPVSLRQGLVHAAGRLGPGSTTSRLNSQTRSSGARLHAGPWRPMTAPPAAPDTGWGPLNGTARWPACGRPEPAAAEHALPVRRQVRRAAAWGDPRGPTGSTATSQPGPAPRLSTQGLTSPAQVPCDPKLLVKPLTTEQLASFWLTSLERVPKKELFFEPDNGVPLNLLDLEKYEVPEEPPPLAPEDEALLAVRPPAELLPASALVLLSSPALRRARTLTRRRGAQEAPKRQRKGVMQGAAGAQPQELSWLMRTSYISSDTARAKSTQQAARAAEADGEAETLDAQLDAIEVCAAVARRGWPPVMPWPVHVCTPGGPSGCLASRCLWPVC